MMQVQGAPHTPNDTLPHSTESRHPNPAAATAVSSSLIRGLDGLLVSSILAAVNGLGVATKPEGLSSRR